MQNTTNQINSIPHQQQQQQQLTIRQQLNSHDDHKLCRFLTTPPLPPLKAAITISEQWTIERLISKIHQTILNEVDPSQFPDLLQPSHRLILELSDGCRLPHTEPCSIIHQDQLLTIRLSPRPQPQSQLASLDYNFHPLMTPQPNNQLLLLPTDTINHSHPPIHPLFDRWETSFTGRPIPFGHQHLLSTQHHQSQGPSQLNQSSPIPLNLGSNDSCLTDLPSIELSDQTNQEQHHQSSLESLNRSQPPFGSPGRSTSLPLQHFPSHRLLPAPVPSRPQHNLSPEHQVNSRPEVYAPPGRQALEFPYCSPSTSSQEPKPTIEELDQSIPPPGPPDVPRVRSHIAAFRKSAFRHYLSSDSESSVDHHRSSSEDHSDQYPSFSRHTRSPKVETASRRFHSSQAKLDSSRPRRLSTRHSMGGPTRRRAATLRPKRKSQPIRCTPDSDDDELIRQSAIIHEEVRRGRKGIKVGDNRHLSTDASNSPSDSSRHQPVSSSSSRPRKNHLLQQVQVVIPVLPGLVSPAYLKRKRPLVEPTSRVSLTQSSIPPSPAGHSAENTSYSTNSAHQSAPEDSLRPARGPVRWATSHNSYHTREPATSRSSIKSCSPVKSRGLTKAKSFSPTKTSRSEPSKLTLSLSAGRTVRSVYQIYVHDEMFKSASGQGPQRIPYSSSGLNDKSSLRQVIERLNLDMHASWKLIIGDKVWLSDASSLKRRQNRCGGNKRFVGLLDGRIVQINWQTTLKELGVFPCSHNLSDADVKPLQIEVIRNWDLK